MRGPVRRVSSRGLRRLGGAVHHLRAARIAEPFYRSAARLDPSNVVAVRRYAEACQARGDTDEAIDALNLAIEDGDVVASDVADCLRRRAAVWTKRRQWSKAAADYRAIIESDPTQVAVIRLLVETMEREGDINGAMAIASRAREDFPAAVAITRWSAHAYTEMGDWDTALGLWLTLTDAKPADAALWCALAASAASAADSPFTKDGNRYRHTTPGERSRWREIAIGALNRVVSQSPSRVRDVFRLGALCERADRISDAETFYERAIDGLERVDAAWTHRSRSAWQFRLDQVRYRRGRLPGDTEGRLDRMAFEDPPCPVISDEDRRGRDDFTGPGSFRVEITDHGLLVEGAVLPGSVDEVVIACDGAPIVTLPVDQAHSLRRFSWTALHSVIETFDPMTRLTVLAGDEPLVNAHGGTTATIQVPGGSGKLGALLGEGVRLNKKGRLSPLGAEASDRATEWLAAYSTAWKAARQRLGRDLFLMYGTLLGVWRDGGLIPGDDDFDIAFRCRSQDPVEMRAEVMDVMCGFIDAGFDVRVAIDGRPFHLGVNGVGIDVNPVWFYKGRCWSFAGHDISLDDMEPIRRAMVGETSVALPHRPDIVLSDNYGPEWRTPTSAFRYFRSPEDLRVLRKMRLTEREVMQMCRRGEAISDANPSAGRFLGYADPEHPSF